MGENRRFFVLTGIRTKIILLVLLVVGMFLIPAALAWLGMNNVRSLQGRIQQNSQILVTLHHLRTGVMQQLDAKGLDLTEAAGVDKHLQMASRRSELHNELRQSLEPGSESSWLDQLESLNGTATMLLRRSPVDSSTDSETQQLSGIYASMESIYSRSIDVVETRGKQTAVASNDLAERSANSVILAIIVTGATGLGVATLLTRRIVRPIGALAVAAGDIAAGKLARRVNIDGHGELHQLGSAFNNMAASLELHTEALVQEQSKLRSVHESITDGIVVFGMGGFIISANPAAEAILGRTEAQLAGSRGTGVAKIDSVLGRSHPVEQQSMVKCWVEQSCERHDCGAYESDDLRCWLQSGESCMHDAPNPGSSKREVCERCPVYRTNACAIMDAEINGHTYSVSVAPIQNENSGNEGRLAVFHDISDERDRTKQLRLLYGILSTIASGQEIRSSLQDSLEICIDAMNASSGSIMLIDEEEDCLTIVAQLGLGDEVTGKRQELGEGIAGWVAVHGEPLLLTEDNPDPRFRRNISDAICIPIMDDNGVVGVMSLNERKKSGFSRESLDFLAPVAVQMGTAISRARLNQNIFEEKEKSTAIVESMGESLCVRSRDRTILFANPAHKRIFGEDCEGQHCFGLYVGRDSTCRGCPLDRCFETGETVRRSHFVKDAEGNRRQLETTASPIRDVDGNIVSCIEISRDVTEMLVMREKAESRLTTLTRLFEVSNILTSSLEMRNILENFTNSAMQAMRASAVTVALFENSDRELVIKARAGDSGACAKIEGSVIEISPRAITNLLTENGPFVAHSTDELTTAAKLLTPPGSQAVVIGSLMSRGKLLGLIAVSSTSKGAFSESGQLDLFIDITNQASVAIDNAEMYHKLEDTFWSIIRSLAEAIDAKDSYTRGHSDRVADYAEALARRLELEEDMQNAVRCAGYLHDTGKIGIPDAILNKPGRLTEDEYLQIMDHPIMSHRIIEPVEFPYEVKALVRHHHERFDGSGYPDGLRGEEIPLGARIIGIADAYEAMTSDRPYRKALTPEAAAEELRRCAGAQFDADLVDEFLDYLREDSGDDPIVSESDACCG